MATRQQPTSAKPEKGATIASRYAQSGLILPKNVLRALEKRGIYCQPGLSVEHQHLARQYVLRGTESGGAVADMARYCAYLDPTGIPVPWLQPIDSLSENGRHAIVIAPELVRIDMLRIGRTYELAISRHGLVVPEGRSRPVIVSTLLHRGHQGTLAIELWKEENRNLRGAIAPIFYTSAGEVRRYPARFEEAIKQATSALSCLGCKRAHIAVAPAPHLGGRL